ncbi:hypothetical protein RJ639_012310 [Escallonia herrerae]|uniref:Uncharacterized protein n=1 Tax=Escallonia herrerae TaxID=1293975 RepID=A0AA88VLJ2_9ASTE|nr:hypothetical protein RJ639_012310 [Escallonia herrerae]
MDELGVVLGMDFMKKLSTALNPYYRVMMMIVGKESQREWMIPLVSKDGANARPLMYSILLLSGAIGIPSFFISFVILPLAMNARTAISAIFPASQKKVKTASLTFSEIYGGVVMNNIMGLSTLLAIVYAKDLTWDYTAEVLGSNPHAVGRGADPVSMSLSSSLVRSPAHEHHGHASQTCEYVPKTDSCWKLVRSSITIRGIPALDWREKIQLYDAEIRERQATKSPRVIFHEIDKKTTHVHIKSRAKSVSPRNTFTTRGSYEG